MFCALLTSRYQVSVYRTNGPLVSFRSVIFSSTSGIKNLELNVNKPPIYLASLRIL